MQAQKEIESFSKHLRSMLDDALMIRDIVAGPSVTRGTRVSYSARRKSMLGCRTLTSGRGRTKASESFLVGYYFGEHGVV